MKKIILLFSTFWLIAISANAQKRFIQAEIDAIPPSQFSSFDLFETKLITSSIRNTLREYVTNFELLEVDTSVLRSVANSNILAIEVNIPFNNTMLTLQLIRSKVVNENTVFFSRNRFGKVPVNYQLGGYYYGVIKDQPNTVVAISFFNNNMIGVIANKNGNYVLGKSNTLNRESNEYVLYREKDLLVKDNAECTTDLLETSDIDRKTAPEEQQQMALSCDNSVGLYIETDHQLYTNQGSSIDNVLDYVTGLYNVTSTLFQNESISTFISEVDVWTVADPYVGAASTLDALTLFANEMDGGFNGDLAHLFSARGLGGGIAYINILCSSSEFRTAVSANLTNVTPEFPTYSWNANVVTHEMGHNLGSRHTHDCAWNGDNTAIDGCGTVAGCPNPGNPASGGTIMSYCHLVDGVGINFNLGFGPQPGDLIRNRVNGATCLNCCLSDIVVNQNVLGGTTDNREASQTITATNIIFNNATATYHAGEQVLLQPGFHTQNGATFHAYIEGCSGAFQARMLPQEVNVQDPVANNPQNDAQTLAHRPEEDITDQEFVIFPNPFTDIINFKYTVTQENSPVLLKIYNIMGEEVKTLVQEQRLRKGIYHVQFNGSYLPEGMYLYRLEAGDMVKTGKIILKK